MSNIMLGVLGQEEHACDTDEDSGARQLEQKLS